MHPASQHTSRGLRIGVAGVFCAGLAGLILLWQQGRAGGTPFAPQVAAVFDKDQLQVGVGLARGTAEPLQGALVVELLDEAGKALDRAETEVDQETDYAQHRVAVRADKSKAGRYRLRVGMGKQTVELPLGKALLAKAHETSITAGTEYFAGSAVALRCGVHGVVSLTQTMPLPGSEVQARLKDKTGKVHELFRGKTGRAGLAGVEFVLPALEAGQYELEIVTRSALGEEKLQRQVSIKAGAKVLLVSDKPIYQPGQLMHLRALALRSFDQKPVEDKDILFEVEDSKGNKVFKKTLTTNQFGVAAVDFQLADEVNMGDYHIRAAVGDAKAEKTVNVKRYVLPKFKVAVKADKSFYLPKETIQAELQSDYFFGKPVAQAKIEVTASTFDVAFRKFHTWKGDTDDNGHAKFEIQLPDYFVGQPLQKGDAMVKLDVKVLDSADHTETIAKTYTVSDQPIRVSLIPEGGKLAPGMENRVFAAAIYPDGSPAANCEVKVWHRKTVVPQPGGPQPGGPPPARVQPRRGGLQPIAKDAALPVAPAAKEEDLGPALATVTTDAAGLAEIKVTPKADQFRQGAWGPRDVETLGGKQVNHGPAVIYDVRAEAKDPKGNTAAFNLELNSHPLGENVLLRLNKAVYQTGDMMDINVHTSAGLPTVYVDVVRGGQIMLSRWLDVNNGHAAQRLDLPPSVYGSVEIHAYQVLAHGEIIRDSRVVYIQPKNDLKIAIDAVKEYAPGEDARIRFTVTDAAGKPAQAALGVIIVDEAVYALQEMQPGLEKVYFTLQEELLKPQVQIKFGDTIDNIVLQPALPAPRQKIAEVLLTSVKLPVPQRWNVAPAVNRKQRAEQQLTQIGNVLYWNAVDPSNGIAFQEFDKEKKRWVFRKNLLDDMVKTRGLPPQLLEGPFGGKLTLDDLARLEGTFTPAQLAQAATVQRLHQVMWSVVHYTNQHQARFKKGQRWTLPDNVVDEVVKAQRLHAGYAKDAWGQPFRLVKRDKKHDQQFGNGQFEFFDLVSLGADGELGTQDDVTRDAAIALNMGRFRGVWWMDADRLAELGDGMDPRLRLADRWGALPANRMQLERARAVQDFAVPLAPAPGAIGGGGPRPMAAKAEAAGKPVPTDAAGQAGGHGGGEAPITRVRDYFPETMLWQPALITDDKGVADLAVNFADSITTWRLSASANARSGALGGTTVPLKVFQDFFVDIDLPVSLTQSDEVAFPVAIYNYLKEPQQLKIELQEEPWFTLLDKEGLTRTLNVKPGDVTAVRFRIKANKIGFQPLLVKAYGSKKSDAVKRSVEVVPNGQKIEKVVSDRLASPDRKVGVDNAPHKIKHVIDIPADAIPDASKLLVRIYPGVMAQVLEGVEGMIRLPGG
ncbi:MAG: MG2 domain-containing protein [Gemmataceae bacterium]|nr:MG2 domain-containing protein [Gemmataceae bacterium]